MNQLIKCALNSTPAIKNANVEIRCKRTFIKKEKSRNNVLYVIFNWNLQLFGFANCLPVFFSSLLVYQNSTCFIRIVDLFLNFIYSSLHRMSHFWDFLVIWPQFGLKHLVWGSYFINSKVTKEKFEIIESHKNHCMEPILTIHAGYKMGTSNLVFQAK